MSLGSALRELGRFLDACRADGTVSSVELSEDEGGDSARTLSAEVVLAASLTEGDRAATLSLAEASVADDGTLRLGLESVKPVLPTSEYDVTVVSSTAMVGDDGSVTVEALVVVPTGEGVTRTGTTVEPAEWEASVVTAGEAGEHTEEEDTDEETVGDTDVDTEESGPLARRNRDVPPFRDRELLVEVYETHDTFAEMTDALGMDVTAETVRRYMVDHGIHQPNSYDTGGSEEGAAAEPATESESAADTEPPQPAADPPVVADGIGLPDDVTVERLIETVKRSNTIYEVRQDIGVEHDDALEMLRELNLLDLVVGRLATEAERDISRDEIVSRLRTASATQ